MVFVCFCRVSGAKRGQDERPGLISSSFRGLLGLSELFPRPFGWRTVDPGAEPGGRGAAGEPAELSGFKRAAGGGVEGVEDADYGAAAWILQVFGRF